MPQQQSAEQQARDLLERCGVEDAQSFSAGDVVELANLIASTITRREFDQLVTRVAALEVKAAQPPKRKTRLREDWNPSQQAMEYSWTNYNHLSLGTELEQFKNHHISRGSTMVDWDRAWYTWLGNSRRFNGPTQRNNDDKIRDLMDMEVRCQD